MPLQNLIKFFILLRVCVRFQAAVSVMCNQNALCTLGICKLNSMTKNLIIYHLSNHAQPHNGSTWIMPNYFPLFS